VSSSKSKLRSVPAVEKVLQALGQVDLPRPAVLAVVRRELAAVRNEGHIDEFEAVVARVRRALDSLRLSRIQPVINATGVLIHTNLGRAPLGLPVVETLSTIAGNYNNLEYDLTNGERGGRALYLEHNLAILCGAEAATVANNCAAALLLMLRHFTSNARKEVIISRGELIQIGGGFRIPEILEASGARLREIGTTNMTSLRDYAKAVSRETALILKVHRSNFSMGGFVESPSTVEIARLARERRVPFVEDLGSGAVLNTQELASIDHEPTSIEVLAQGAQLVCFSGDKLLGGVQAGIIAGSQKLVKALKREPFFRALRCDKLILSALQTVVDLYLDGSENQIPVLEMLRAPKEELRRRADKLLATLSDCAVTASIGEGKARIGGGSLPASAIGSITVDLVPHNIGLEALAARLRLGSPAVIGYISSGRCRFDLRTVFPRQDQDMARAISAALQDRE
jgi:L-seryl-tRNA(Ser) seleniumtransferase